MRYWVSQESLMSAWAIVWGNYAKIRCCINLVLSFQSSIIIFMLLKVNDNSFSFGSGVMTETKMLFGMSSALTSTKLDESCREKTVRVRASWDIYSVDAELQLRALRNKRARALTSRNLSHLPYFNSNADYNTYNDAKRLNNRQLLIVAS